MFNYLLEKGCIATGTVRENRKGFPTGLAKAMTKKSTRNNQAPVVQKLDSAIHRINSYPVNKAIGFSNTYPLDSDLSGGRYPTFEQLGPGGLEKTVLCS